MTQQSVAFSSSSARPSRLVPSELAFLRFVAGIRALLAALVGVILIATKDLSWGLEMAVVLPYLMWAAVLLWLTLGGWPGSAERAWLWLDAAALVLTSMLVMGPLPLFGVMTVLPVVAMAVLVGARPAMALALVSAIALLVMTGLPPSFDSMPPLPVSVPIIVLAAWASHCLAGTPES